MVEYRSEYQSSTIMGSTSAEEKLEKNSIWWMSCQQHIRDLRVMLNSNTADKEAEIPLRKCVALYMAQIKSHSSLQDQKVLHSLSGESSLNQSSLISSKSFYHCNSHPREGGTMGRNHCDGWAAYTLVSGGNVTPLEASFMWLGGWRPTSALLLVYSLMGVQLENEILRFRDGVRGVLENSSAILSERQLTNLKNVQKYTRQTEKKLSTKLATLQMLLSDRDVVQAVMIMMVGGCDDQSSTNPRSNFNKNCDLKTVLKPRMSRLKKLLIQADQLRLHTLHQLFLVLTPVQVARCAIAAFELAFGMRALGTSSTSPSNSSSSSASSSGSKLNPPTQFAKPKICSEITPATSVSDDDENDQQPSTSGSSSYDYDDDIDTTDVVFQHLL